MCCVYVYCNCLCNEHQYCLSNVHVHCAYTWYTWNLLVNSEHLSFTYTCTYSSAISCQIASSSPLPRDSLPSTSRAHDSIQSSERISSPSSRETSERKRNEKKRRAELSESEVASVKKRKRDESDSVKPSSSGNSSSSRKRLWVAPNLRVRIVDTEFRRGKFYNNKVRNACSFTVITACCIL